MAPKKRTAATGGTRSSARVRRSGRANQRDEVPDVYRELLVEAGASSRRRGAVADPAEPPPPKRKRPGEKVVPKTTDNEPSVQPSIKADQDVLGQELADEDEDEGEEDVTFEDVALPAPTVQTILRDSDDEDDDEDEAEAQFEDVDLSTLGGSAVDGIEEPKTFSLTINPQRDAPTPRRSVDRRRPVTKAEKDRRVEIHKMHLLCLLSHVSRRNRWCNDPEVHETLRALLPEKTIKYLNPSRKLPQFGQTESLKNGLDQAAIIFKSNYSITERGLRRALWAETEEQLQNYEVPDDIETCLHKSDFRAASSDLQGSRDVGAQLFCAMLRSAGVEARLVCSLQVLSSTGSGPSMPVSRASKISSKKLKADAYRAALEKYESKQAATPTATSSPRRRLGHPNATAYNVPTMSSPTSSIRREAASAPKTIRGESPFPIYWVEVLDVAHQKWQPVDPIVTGTQWKPRVMEPPASDNANCMTYAIAFEADGSAKDVTRRYAKAYNAKTRKMRIDGISAAAKASGSDNAGVVSGERWWRRVMRHFAKPYETDVDEIEDAELAAVEAREPMPRNVQDFKDHPVYALERHLRRHEVLVPGAQAAGTVGAGSKGPLERIYRRRDVRVARSRDKWYRLGREVKIAEDPVKILPKRVKRKRPFDDDDDEADDDPDKVGLFGDEAAGTPIFMIDQTELYIPPPVVNGRVPKNKFGNLEVYVPSMVPEGGVYIVDERAAHAAFVLGIDYAPALTGFQFKGRQGTAVLQGAVVPEEAEEAVKAVVLAFGDLEAEMEQERRARAALRMWARLLRGLRLRERIWARADPDEDKQSDGESTTGKEEGVAENEDIDMDDAGDDDLSGHPDVDDEEMAGGFFVD